MWSYWLGVFNSPVFNEELQVRGVVILEKLVDDRGDDGDDILFVSASEIFDSFKSLFFDSDRYIGGGNWAENDFNSFGVFLRLKNLDMRESLLERVFLVCCCTGSDC